ncbi:MAG TPA: alkaline phosphatase family protein [Acidimicrobiales bacterium]|nr:alkaline phosphatase family protein [Acidimicrobiales bacterium]
MAPVAQSRAGRSLERTVVADPVLPDYGGASIDHLVPSLLAPVGRRPDWLPDAVIGARQIVLLVLDGLGWEQLRERHPLAPYLASMEGRRITSVVPTTTATALTSITTGLPPAAHEIVGYRVKVGKDVLNVLRWRAGGADARQSIPPAEFQTRPVFGGTAPPVVTRAEFSSSGFTTAHLPGVDLRGWQMPSTLLTHVKTLIASGAPLVYAYYDGIDKVAHEYGFGPFYDAELVRADRLVADMAATLRPGAALVVTADHGQVEVGDNVISLERPLTDDVTMMSGEGRFRWLHAKPGTKRRLAERATEALADVAWVRTVDQLDEDRWFGGPLTAAGRDRLGDVALIAHRAVAFLDPADPGEARLQCRHGSVTAAEMWVPLLAVAR